MSLRLHQDHFIMGEELFTDLGTPKIMWDFFLSYAVQKGCMILYALTKRNLFVVMRGIPCGGNCSRKHC